MGYKAVKLDTGEKVNGRHDDESSMSSFVSGI